jgi:predicted PurR-regulated permease PerM
MTHNWSHVFRYWILSILTITFSMLLWFGRELITPLIIACLLAFVLNPAIGFLMRRVRMTRPVAVNIVFFTGLGSLATLPAIMLPRLVSEIQVFFGDLQSTLTQVQDFVSQPVIILGWIFNFETLLPDFTRLLSESITAVPENAFRLLEDTTKSLIWGLVILVATYCLLKDWSRLRDSVFFLIPAPYQPDARHLFREIREVWQGYLRGNLALMLFVGVAFSLAWTVIGLPGALLLGIITGLFTIIPDLGPTIAAVLAVLVALFEGSTYLQISNLWFALLVIGIYLLLINIKGVWLRPLIFARSVHMHGGVVFIAIMAAVVLQGILGALLVVPVMASAGVLGGYTYRRLLGLTPWPVDAETNENFTANDEESDPVDLL